MQRISVSLLGILCFLCVVSAGGAEYEINLLRNPTFLPGMDWQGPKDWSPHFPRGGRTNICEAGRGNITFTEDGIILGPGQLFQFGDLWDDISPAYRFSCRTKTEGAKGAIVELRIRDSRNVLLRNTELDVWEDLTMDVTPDGHYGFCVTITVPEGSKLHIRSIKIVAVLDPAEDGGGQVLISDNGRDVPVRGIRLPAAPNRIEQLAAHELRVNTYLISGAVLPVFAGDSTSDEKGYIRITSLKKKIPEIPVPREQVTVLKEPEANGFRLVCRDGNIELTGGNDAGVLAGAMHLSERMGAKFYAPRVYTIATNRTLKIPGMAIARQAAFEWTTGPAAHVTQTLMAWKYGYLHSESCIASPSRASPPTSGWVHPPVFLAPPHVYAENHPDYYALVKGERTVRQGNNINWGYLHLCLGNPELQQVVAERVGRLMDLYPQCKYFSIAQGDGSDWCECDLCTALDVDKENLMDRMIAYANAVATLLEEKHPDRKVVLMAYSKGREDLPLREKPHPNVAVQYAFWPSSWPDWELTFCERNQRGLKMLDDWNALTGTNITIFTYPVNTYENSEKLKLFAKKGIRGFHQCGLRGDFPEVTLYVTGQLIWDPDADVEKMIDEILPVMFGAASVPMREYFDLLHAFIRDPVLRGDDAKRHKYFDDTTRRGSGSGRVIKRAPPACTEKALALLARAAQIAAGDKYAMEKINRERLYVLYADINDLMAVNSYDVPDELFEDYAAKMAELVELARKCREPFASYRVPFSEWLYQTSGGALDFNREPHKWFNDKKIDLFLADPIKTLKTQVYFQTAIPDGIEWPAEAWTGSRYNKKYLGAPGVVVRRKSSSESRVKAYFKFDELPKNAVELQLQGLDNDKEKTAEIKITINGIKIFAGPVAYPKNKWEFQTYKIPAGVLKLGENVISIENTMDDDIGESTVGQAGPAGESMAGNYNWGWCMLGTARLTWKNE